MYLGVRGFARLIGTKNLLSRISILLPAVIVLCAASVLLPHVPTKTAEIALDISNALLVWVGVMEFSAGMLILAIRRRMGAHYRYALAWLSMGLCVSCAIAGSSFVHALLSSGERDSIGVLISAGAVIAGLVYLGAGYAFSQTEDY